MTLLRLHFDVGYGLAACDVGRELGEVSNHGGFNKNQPEVLKPDGAEVYARTFNSV
jgi:hypothetical protein